MKVLELATPIFSLHKLKNLWVLLNVESDFPFLPFYFVATFEAMNLVGIYTILFCARMFPKSCEINGYFLRS